MIEPPINMDINILIGSLQVVLAALQIKLDHFKSNQRHEIQSDEFYELGEAIRTLESALAETVSFVAQTDDRQPNPRLASLWLDASNCIRNIRNGADLADLTFEKNLYWRNPEFYRDGGENKLFRISLDNVLIQLRKLRNVYEKLQRR